MAWLERINQQIGRVNLAPVKYHELLKPNAIIDRVVVGPYINLFGKTMYQATAYLSEECLQHKDTHHSIYGDADGTGTSENKTTAVYKAISEALERWAFWDFSNSPLKAELGFDLDPTTAGIAAYPGANPWWAKRLAMNEAFERWALVRWWNGELSLAPFEDSRLPQKAGLNYFRFLVDELPIVLASYQFQNEGRTVTAYGFAASQKIEAAAERALIELERNMHALKAYFARGETSAPKEPFEKRLLFYSSEDGHKEFLSHIGGQNQATLPRLIFDGEIVGPWLRYAVVWRSLPDGTYTDQGFMF